MPEDEPELMRPAGAISIWTHVKPLSAMVANELEQRLQTVKMEAAQSLCQGQPHRPCGHG